MRDGDDYVIDGSKRFISQGSVADLVTVFAVTDPARARRATSACRCFVVENATRPASASSGSSTRWASAARPTAELAFDGVRVPGGEPARRGGRGVRDRDADVRPEPRPGIAAQAVGIAQGALEVATRLRAASASSSASRSASSR